MALPTMPSTHAWFRGGPGLKRVGNTPQGGGPAIYASASDEVWVWDEDTDTRITDLLDENANPITSPAIDAGWISGVGIPVATVIASFSIGQFGKRYELVSVQTLKNAQASTAPTDTQVQTLVNDTGSATRAALDGEYATLADNAAKQDVATLGANVVVDATVVKYLGKVIVLDASSATTDMTATIQNALTLYRSVTIRCDGSTPRTARIDGTLTVGARSLYLEAGVTLQRYSDAASTDPVIRMFNSNSVVQGSGQTATLIKSQKPAPFGVVCVGALGPSDLTNYTANLNTIRDVEISGMTAGGQTTGTAPDIALLHCNNQPSTGTSYFNAFRNVRLSNSNIGLCLMGWANAGQHSNIQLQAVGNNGTLGGAGVKLVDNGSGKTPLENHISGVFHNGSSNATSLVLSGAVNYNYLSGFVCEQGGTTAKFVSNDNDACSGNIISGVDNVSGGSSLTASFLTKNMFFRRGDFFAATATTTVLGLSEIAAPSTPAANGAKVYAKDNGSGKTQLVVKFSDGAEIVLATQA